MRPSLQLLVVVVLLSLLLRGAESASQYSYVFPYNSTTGVPINPYYNPAYSLGTLSVNYSITVSITLPNTGSSTQLKTFIDDIIANASLGLQYMDYTQNPPVLTQAVDSTGAAFTIPVYSAINNLPNVYSFTYPIAFPIAYTLPSALFYLVLGDTVVLDTNKLLDIYTLQVTYFPSLSGSSVSNPASLVTLLKVTDIIRGNVVKLIYISQANTTESITTFPATYNNGGTITPFYTVNIYSLGITNPTVNGFNGNQFTLTATTDIYSISGTPLASIESVTGTYINNLAHYTFSFATAGYYLLEFQADPLFTGFVDGKITYQSDSYACPYQSGYSDYYLNFQGCVPQAVPTSGLPCASFNFVTMNCVLCVTGYTLLNGSCWANTTCPARQYFHFGSCLDVSPTCGAFDVFTGLCLNCSDSANYYLINGSCIHKAVTCAANQWQTNYTCYNASSTCATFDPNSGKCLTCLSNFYQLNSDGTCTLIVVTCPSGQYAVGLSCVTIPVECLNFDTTLGKCLSCIKGYYVQNGVCQRIVCPNGQVPSNYGIFCVDVSPLCADYDSITGDCLSCQNSGYTVRNGACLQEGSPLAGCQERQHLGFGPCIGADLNCDTFNLVTGNCDKCIQGYYLDYTGHCANSVNCGVGQWGVNGECIGIPENCLKVDNLGLCTLCVNSNYRLQQGQCVYFKSCQAQQYLNAGGQCIDVSISCATWNPSNGQCISCKTAGTQPISGICCPTGQVYNSGQCVDAVVLQNSYQNSSGPSCLIRHPSLNFCLKCNEGYSPDYTVPYACASY